MLEFAVIASGYLVSGDVDLRQRRLEAVFVPTLLASGTLAVQGNVDTTSANFFRMLEARAAGSGDMQFAVGVGSRMLPWPAGVPQPAYARFEILTAAGSIQHDNRTLTLITRPR